MNKKFKCDICNKEFSKVGWRNHFQTYDESHIEYFKKIKKENKLNRYHLKGVEVWILSCVKYVEV